MTESVNSCTEEELVWLDDAYVCKILTAYERKPIKLHKFKKELATSKGENYASALHRVVADYEIVGNQIKKNISMIVKSRRESEFMNEIEEEFNIFEREAQLYKIIMTSCEDLLATIDDNTKFGPRALYVDERVIVQEDLKKRGYHICDVKTGLTYEQARQVLEKVAKFHATTRVLYDKDPSLFRYHLSGNLTENETPYHNFYRYTFSTCIEYIKTIPELKEYVEKLRKYEKDVIKRAVNVFTRSPNGFNILNHGDLWVNNLMYKTDEAGIIDVLLVDYQEGYFGSPGIDLNYFIYSSLQSNVYKQDKLNLIEVYHQVLTNTLKKLRYDKPIPSLDDVLNEFYSKGDHGLFTATCFFPAVCNEHIELADPENFLNDNEESRKNRLIIYNNPKYKNYLKIVFKDFTAQNIL